MHVTWILLARIMIIAALPLGVIAQIPSGVQIAVIAGGALFMGAIPLRLVRVPGIVLLLLAWALTEARQVLNVVEQLTTTPAELTLRITDVREHKQQLTAQVIRIGERYAFPPLFVSIGNISPDTHYCAGQRWRMKLRLRPVHARLNEGEFDLQRFAVANHSPLQGRIISQQAESLRCSWRSQLINQHLPHMSSLMHAAILQALAFGMRNDMTAEQRQLLRDTGTAHLMAISGMHIALAASTGWLLARALQLLFPAHRIGALFPLGGSLLASAVYCWLSGSHAPAQRALLALMLWLGVKTAGWQLSGWQVWTLCVGFLLWLDPLTVLSESFWLSALAVAFLIIWFQWFALPARFNTSWRWLPLRLAHLQLGMMILMAPLQIFLFHGISISALAANLIAVPVISLITVPVILMAMLSPLPWLSAQLWKLADLSVHMVMHGLQQLPPGWLPLNGALPAMLLLWCGLLLWRSGLYRYAIVPCGSLLLGFIIWREQAQRDSWQIDMLDVGHGLAVVISQGDRAVLYDTGPGWAQDDAGARVVLPWLHYHGLKPEAVILSHRHLDHRGGLASIRKAHPAVPVRSALAEYPHLPCYRGQQWQWGILTFTALWPPAGETAGHNNDSCVVRVDDGSTSLLLTGDIESEAEKALVSLEKERLSATFIQVPHHGSRTSSGALLLRNVAGQAALASVARYNAWRLPAQAVIERYRQHGYDWYDTAQSGQIHIGIQQGRWQIAGLREQLMPRWYHQWFGVKRESR